MRSSSATRMATEFPRVAGVLLVGQPEEQDLDSADRPPALIQRQQQAADKLVRQVAANVVGQLHGPEPLAERPSTRQDRYDGSIGRQ
jgi:hypothetical protein